MKNLKSILVLALVVLFASCSADSLIKKLHKAAEAGDVEKAAKVMKRLDKKGKLTDDQLKQVSKATTKLAENKKVDDAAWKKFVNETKEVDLSE